MQKQIIQSSFLTIAICLSLFSCTKEVDFEQAEDFEISPVMESSLIFFDEAASSFSLNSSGTVSIDSIEIDFFSDKFIVDNVIKADFEFEGTNSISRAFQVKIDLINDVGQELHTFTLTAASSSDGSDVLSTYTEEFEGDKLIDLKNTSRLVFTLSLLPGETIDQTTPGRIKLRSKAVFYFNIGDSV